MTEEYAIIDDAGILHSGLLEEMNYAWDVMTNPHKHTQCAIKEWCSAGPIQGDLLFVNILKRFSNEG